MGLIQNGENEEQIAKQLASDAGKVIAMLKGTLRTEQGTDLTACLLYAAGLAGMACHEAVKASNGSFHVATVKDGRKFYFGDDVNRYLLEGRTSVFSFCNAVTNVTADTVRALAVSVVQRVGGEDLTIWNMPADIVYQRIKTCWDGIHENMTVRFCKAPSEWPVLYGIVMQNILLESIKVGAPAEEAGRMAMECALVISRMDTDSLKTNPADAYNGK
ncbi:MAG: hypothetical protein IJ201_06645 [Solobacterium sp.]|nr:hypothetical protein [Solobacterium sp.]